MGKADPTLAPRETMRFSGLAIFNNLFRKDRADNCLEIHQGHFQMSKLRAAGFSAKD